MIGPIQQKPRHPSSAGLRAFVLLLRIAVSGGEERLRYGQQFLQALEGDTFERALRALLATPAGVALASRQPDSLSILRDRASLLACPPGSIGRHYADFLSANGLDESYYTRLPLPEPPESDRQGERRWFRARLEYAHDLRHVLAGYPPDDLGEICLMGFRFGQIGHRGALALVLLGLLHKLRYVRAVCESIDRGRRARLLDVLAWEERLAEPLATVRAALAVEPTRRFPSPYAPEAYLAARSSHDSR